MHIWDKQTNKTFYVSRVWSLQWPSIVDREAHINYSFWEVYIDFYSFKSKNIAALFRDLGANLVVV